MLITERSTYMESVSVALAELLLTVCKRIYCGTSHDAHAGAAWRNNDVFLQPWTTASLTI